MHTIGVVTKFQNQSNPLFVLAHFPTPSTTTPALSSARFSCTPSNPLPLPPCLLSLPNLLPAFSLAIMLLLLLSTNSPFAINSPVAAHIPGLGFISAKDRLALRTLDPILGVKLPALFLSSECEPVAAVAPGPIVLLFLFSLSFPLTEPSVSIPNPSSSLPVFEKAPVPEESPTLFSKVSGPAVSRWERIAGEVEARGVTGEACTGERGGRDGRAS